MSIFATEFPVQAGLTKANFVAAAIAWIRGINKSTVLDQLSGKELHDDDVTIESGTGEVLQFKVYAAETLEIIGVRHELPDDLGRVWRTECVLSTTGGSSTLRVRGQCVARDPSAEVQLPKKPYFISLAIDEGWGSKDDLFDVKNTPHLLAENDIDTALAVVKCSSLSMLPHVYVSRGDDNSLSVNVDILSRKLAGMAHVVVEPTRSFSFQLMGKSFRKNPYAGAVGIFLPGHGEVKRYFALGPTHQQREKSTELVEDVVRLVSKRIASRGWEWQGLQEYQGRALRTKIHERASDDLDDYIAQFDKEIYAKDERIKNLEQLLEIAETSKSETSVASSDILPAMLSEAIGPQLYDGEFSDRLRLVIEKSLMDEKFNFDERTQEMARRLLSKTSYTGRSVALANQIKSAGRDGNEMTRNIGSILLSFGYKKSMDGKHIKFEPPEEFFGLPTEILPSTPSDSQRGGKNKSADIIRAYGLNSLR